MGSTRFADWVRGVGVIPTSDRKSGSSLTMSSGSHRCKGRIEGLAVPLVIEASESARKKYFPSLKEGKIHMRRSS